MTPGLVYGAGIAICVVGLVAAAYLLDVPVAWIAGAVAALGIAVAALARRRARRRQREAR